MMMQTTIAAALCVAALASAAASGCGGSAYAGPGEPAHAAKPPARSGPEQLERLLARYDQLAEGREKQALALQIDAVAGQRYAYVSRLYWHTDLEEAKAEARRTGRPILSLRLLGRLDEELSCVNSRYFRVALYANATVSRLLRERFVLHWSSERPVPRVTVDFGDGRKLERTIAGNSAHFVLDAEGRPVDVLPGLYGPTAFVRELEAALPVAQAAATQTQEQRGVALARFHEQRLAALEKTWGQDARGISIRPGALGNGTLLQAEYMTVSKASFEVPLVRAVKLGSQELGAVADDSWLWRQLGEGRAADSRLDAQSLALVRTLAPTDWSDAARPLAGKPLEALVAGFEATLAADTALAEFKLHYVIHQWFVAGAPATASFEALGREIYATLFLTPRSDAWLGMATPGAFAALPRDGILWPEEVDRVASAP